MAKLGLVTILYKSESVLEGFFKSLSGQSFIDYHLFLIDNSPSAVTDALIDNLLLKYPITQYTHLKNSENVGVAKGNNQGIELSLQNNSEYILLLNNDIEFYQKELITDMVACAESRAEAMIIPKILYFDSKRIWMAGGAFLKAMGYTIHVGENEYDSPKYSKSKYFDYAPTCFMLIHRHVFEKVGLMDEKYFVYYDDSDFVYRSIKSGFKIFLISNMEVFHKVSSSTGGNETLFSIYYTNRNRIYFIRKNLTQFYKLSALGYTFLTRIPKLISYNKEQRNKLLSGFKDGFKIV